VENLWRKIWCVSKKITIFVQNYEMLKLLTYLILGFAAIHASRAATTDPGPDPRSGLRFISHDDIKDNRTSLCLTPRSALRLGRDFALEFDVRLAEAQHTFGYVFRMVLDDRVSLDMVSNMEVGNPSVVFTFDNRKIAEFVLRNAAGEPDYDRWMKVVARYHHDSEELEVGVDTLSHRAPIGLGRHSRARIWLGACDHPDHVTTDVPPMDVRDVRVVGATAEPRRWRLGRHDGPTAWDDTRRHPALARNPVWIVDGYAHWHRRIVETLPANYLNMAARADSGVIHFAALDHLATYDNATRKLARDTILNRMPFMLESIQMVYDPQRGRLVTYDVESRTISAMPLGAGAPRLWSETAPQRPIPRYAHHNAAWVGAIDRAVTFGGYGEHTYKSTLNIVAPDGSWESHLPLDSIPPRYLAGMAVDRDGTLIVAGGYGSLSGQQSESPHNFYDIWRIDPRTGRTIPLGEMVRDEAEEHFVVGRDMVLSPDGKTLYALL
jgi:hypothetical protein